MCLRYVAFLFFFTLSGQLWAQLDSLAQAYEQATSLEEQSDALNDLFSYFEYKRPDTAKYLAQQALATARKADYQEGIARSYLHLAEYYSHNNYYVFDSVDYYLQKSIAIYEAAKDTMEIANAYYSIGQSCYHNDNFNLAKDYCQNAADLYETIGRELQLAHALSLLCDIHNYMGDNELALTKCMLARDIYDELGKDEYKPALLNTMGSINYDIKLYGKAKDHLLESMELSRKFNDDYALSSAYISMGEVLRETTDYEGALEFFRRALALDRSNDDDMGMSYAYFNIGKTRILQGENEQAISLLEGALDIAESFGDLMLQTESALELGRAYLNLNQMDRAFHYLNLSLGHARKIGTSPILKDCYFNMANYYYRANDFENALAYYKFYDLEQQSLYQQESAKRIAEYEVKYESDKKDKELLQYQQDKAIQELQANERKMVNYGLILGIILLSGLGMVLYSKYQLKNKANLELERQKEAIHIQKIKIEKQRDEIVSKSKLLEESKQDITDSIMYAKRIQLSLLPEKDQLKHLFPDSLVFFRPKDIVSGDFYWIHETGDKVVVAVLDCTGHGVPGAFMTVLSNSILNELVLENCVNTPNVILSVMDTKIREALHQHQGDEDANSDGLDMAVCIIDRKTSELSYSGAQMPMYVTHHGSLIQLKPNRFSLGGSFFSDKNFSNQCIKLNRGDMLYMATDGFQDQFGGPKDKKFMRSNFKALLENIHLEPVSKQGIIIQEAFENWKSEQIQTDDVLVMGIRI
ncbi:tetratricopeptide repeat protein [Catalinimonas niigatensis]|uniref:tetratricopeptide repeat protein n=1 Tax=Catalinimonas niigatensis TaxID=1397264 RepID=UPI00266586E7|nr:tetratricopeptide repeat protein [Catalinimonas niigatensis]WPP51614.1 tetratricopeptide repeat protein [Catalinimonas niigatensis]